MRFTQQRLMLGLISGLCGILFAALPAAAQDAGPTGKLAEATRGPSKVGLWRTGDADTTVYVLGTMHLLPPGVAWETSAIKAAWDSAGTVYFEADIDDTAAVAELSSNLVRLGFFADGTKFASFFSAAEVKRMDALLKPYNLNAGTFANMRPWFAGLSVSQMAIERAGGRADAGVDLTLAQRAEISGKTQRFFETPLQQLELIAAIPDKEQARVFIEGLEEISDIETYFAKMIGAWYRGDAYALAAILGSSMADAPQTAKAVLYDRNARWAVTLDEVIKNEPGTFFVAVGAGHLAGENSLQFYLRQFGHVSERVGRAE